MISNRPPNRVEPAGEPKDYRTFSIAAPRSTHSRIARCEEVDCHDHLNGWVTVLEVAKPERAQLAFWIRNKSGRQFHESKVAYVVNDAGETVEQPLADGWRAFYFAAGQQCFTEHTVPLDRPELYIAKNGDWRGTVGSIHRYDRSDQFADDLYTHTEHIREVRSRG